MDNHYNRSFNGQNLGNDFASSFQFVVPRIRDIFIRPVHTAIEFGKMNSAILGTTMILINMAVLLVLAVIVKSIFQSGDNICTAFVILWSTGYMEHSVSSCREFPTYDWNRGKHHVMSVCFLDKYSPYIFNWYFQLWRSCAFVTR